MKILVTGSAGFIGMHVCNILLSRGDDVVGLDNLNNYYDSRLKLARVGQNKKYKNFRFVEADIADQLTIQKLFGVEKFDRVINLAAQPGVRYSIENPHAYIQSNLVGFSNILEACSNHAIGHLVYASSSSVYGSNTSVPYSAHDNVDHPISLYAATKKSNELLAHSYSHLFNIPTTGLRYFSVYGSWGRPDMAPWLFTEAILKGRPIDVFNMGKMKRDFTYVEDVARVTVAVLDKPAAPNYKFNPSQPDPSTSFAPYKIYNVGNNTSIELIDFIREIERTLGVEAKKNFLKIQDGDVIETFADIDDLRQDFEFTPSTPLTVGIKSWVSWYVDWASKTY